MPSLSKNSNKKKKTNKDIEADPKEPATAALPPNEPTDTQINFKCRRDSRDQTAKKIWKKSQPMPPQENNTVTIYATTTQSSNSSAQPSTSHAPSSSHISTTKKLSRSLSENRDHKFKTLCSQLARSASPDQKLLITNEKSEANKDLQAIALCFNYVDLNHDFVFWRVLIPLLKFQKVNNTHIVNPRKFRVTPMVTTFIRSVGRHTKGVLQWLARASKADLDMRLVELEHSSLKKMANHCAGRVPVYVPPSVYRALKIRYLLDVGGLSRDNQVTTDHRHPHTWRFQDSRWH